MANKSLLNAYCSENNLQLLRYKDTQEEVFGQLEEGYNNVPPDFVSLTTFLVENMYTQVRRTKMSRFCSKFNKSMTLKKSKRKSNKTVEKKRNVLLIDYLPQCLKFYQPEKATYLAELNQILTKYIQSPETNILIFTFSENKEANRKFLSKIFTEEVFAHSSTTLLSLNQMTERNIK